MLLLVFSFLTVQRNAEWHTQLSLYSHDVQYAGDSPLLYANYGGLLIVRGQFDKAEPYLARSVALDPQLSHNLNNLAVIYEQKKDYSQAKNLYWRNIHMNAVIARYVAVAYCGLARIALLHEKNPQEAKRLSEIGLRKNPTDTQLLKFLALSDYQLGQKDEALAVAKKLYATAPGQGRALYGFIQNNKPMSLVDPLYGVTYSF
jgi:tetratricopeptide (TPR) repeat protein